MSKRAIKRIAINTGGGDAPGLNAVIRAVVLSATRLGWEVYGIRDAYNGLLMPEQYPEGGLIRLSFENVRGITHLGGTIIGTTNRNNPLQFPVPQPDGTLKKVDRTDELIQILREHQIDALVSVGGDGSLAIADALSRKGMCVIGVPKTIDNDLDKTQVTFGFDTAVSFATEALDRLQSTAASHGRIMIVEVMGRYAGWIALNAGISGSADVILIPEIPYDIHKVVEKIHERKAQGSRFAMIMVAEGARPVGGAFSVLTHGPGQNERLGGVGEKIAAELEALTGKETRVVVLGHLLRGGTPTSFDRLIALRFGAAAVRGLAKGREGVMVVLDPPNVRYVPFRDIVGRIKTVKNDSDTVQTALDLGISFGV